MDIKIIRSDRKTMSLNVDDALQAVVRAPFSVSDHVIKEFVDNNRAWLDRAVSAKQKQLERFNVSEDEKMRLKRLAQEIIPKKVAQYSALMGLEPAGVKITSAKKRFGSCSGKNSLCFSYYLMRYPDEAIDYVVVHELAHIKHHDHSREFYTLIAKYMPDYRQREKLLK